MWIARASQRLPQLFLEKFGGQGPFLARKPDG